MKKLWRLASAVVGITALVWLLAQPGDSSPAASRSQRGPAAQTTSTDAAAQLPEFADPGEAQRREQQRGAAGLAQRLEVTARQPERCSMLRVRSVGKPGFSGT